MNRIKHGKRSCIATFAKDFERNEAKGLEKTRDGGIYTRPSSSNKQLREFDYKKEWVILWDALATGRSIGRNCAVTVNYD